MDGWVCVWCRSLNGRDDAACRSCAGRAVEGGEPGDAYTAVTVVRSVRDDTVSAALAGSAYWPGGTGETPVLQPFFELAEAPRRTPRQRLAALWPGLVLLVVLAYFAVAALTR